MTKEKMTIHPGLSELKLIDNKILKAIESLDPAGLVQEGKLVNGFYPKEDFEKQAKATFQSITDLIQRKNKIKSAIVATNGTTVINVAGQSMTIADAINFKSVIDFQKKLVETIYEKYTSVKSRFVKENERVQNVALENAKIMLGKQGDDKVKPTDEDVKNIMEPFIKRNSVNLVDPLEVEALLPKLQNGIDEFTSEVDAVLSEINAITFIEF